MQNNRPKNLNLFTIRFPLPAILSILHRISGIVLFLLIPLLLWELDNSLTQAGFDDLQTWFTSPACKVIFWLICLPLVFHLTSGIRHLLSDINIGNSLRGGKRTSVLALIIFILLALLLGIWIW
jgi:succinate dehydrogenase cytochrome b subunit